MLDVQKVADALLEHVRRLVAPLAQKIAELEARKPEKGDKGEQGDPGVPGAIGTKGDTGAEGMVGAEGPPGRDGRDGQSGRDGKDGEHGKDGAPGLDGKDGLGFDDLTCSVEDGGRVLVLKFICGDKSKEFRLTTHTMIYRGVFKEGEPYEHGDTVTWAGSLWHCNEETKAKPGDREKAWTLAAKRGNDGNNGLPGKNGDRGPQGLPGRDRA